MARLRLRPAAFLILTGLGAAAAFATGRALASGWSPRWRIVPAMIALAAAMQFLHYALFQEELLSLHYYLVTLVVLLVVAWLGYASKRARQMATQYSWAFDTRRPDLAAALTSLVVAAKNSRSPAPGDGDSQAKTRFDPAQGWERFRLWDAVCVRKQREL